jgi:hypothetical protein
MKKKDKPIFYKKEIDYTRCGIVVFIILLVVFYVIG